MKHFFYGLSVLGLGSVAYAELAQEPTTDHALIVTGMPPQIELIRELASQEDYTITCEGNSGEMTALRLAPSSRADAATEEAFQEKLWEVSTSISLVSGSDATGPECDHAPSTIETEYPSENTALAIGSREALEPQLAIAKSCGFSEASLEPLSEFDRERIDTDTQPGWLGLYAGPQSLSRKGPSVCYSLMSYRLQNSASPS